MAMSVALSVVLSVVRSVARSVVLSVVLSVELSVVLSVALSVVLFVVLHVALSVVLWSCRIVKRQISYAKQKKSIQVDTVKQGIIHQCSHHTLRSIILPLEIVPQVV